jgi:hypothetical protein
MPGCQNRGKGSGTSAPRWLVGERPEGSVAARKRGSAEGEDLDEGGVRGSEVSGWKGRREGAEREVMVS